MQQQIVHYNFSFYDQKQLSSYTDIYVCETPYLSSKFWINEECKVLLDKYRQCFFLKCFLLNIGNVFPKKFQNFSNIDSVRYEQGRIQNGYQLKHFRLQALASEQVQIAFQTLNWLFFSVPSALHTIWTSTRNGSTELVCPDCCV